MSRKLKPQTSILRIRCIWDITSEGNNYRTDPSFEIMVTTLSHLTASYICPGKLTRLIFATNVSKLVFRIHVAPKPLQKKIVVHALLSPLCHCSSEHSNLILMSEMYLRISLLISARLTTVAEKGSDEGEQTHSCAVRRTAAFPSSCPVLALADSVVNPLEEKNWPSY